MSIRVSHFLAAACVLAAVLAPQAHAAFPFNPQTTPSDLSGKETWMYAATPEAGNLLVNAQASELMGVRGAHLVDAGSDATAWRTTAGRPDVVIAVHDSGIKWNDTGAMRNLRFKTHLNAGELPTPEVTRGSALEDGVDCGSFSAGRDDADGNGVFNVRDFACDPRVERDGAQRAIRGNGVDSLLDPQDVLIAFSDGADQDGNGFKDDIVGWDFLDNDNDPYDDVQYGHGTGEAQDSTAEADNGQDGVGTCPNCMVMYVRVGDSFVADVNRFAQGVLYATDNGALVVQEALGALNNSRFARQAVDYAFRHGVTIIASAADEAAQHHHWPESYPGVIVVNSVTKYDETFTPYPRSYLQFNGCTNFSSKVDLAIPSVSCSSDATGRASGMAGLVYSAALDAGLTAPGCTRPGGAKCALSAAEVRQVMASGTVGGVPQADDVNFATLELSCSPLPLPACTDPQLNTILGANGLVVSPIATSRRYPARTGHDQFYGYGRVNMKHAVDAVAAGKIPPAVQITAPDWYSPVDPGQPTVPVSAQISARSGYRCRVLVAPGSYPNNAEAPAGDFAVVPSAQCNGTTVHDEPFDGVVAQLDVAALKKRFPVTSGDFTGREPGIGVQTAAGRPNTEPYGFIVKVEATTAVAKGEDRRNLYLHRDAEMLPGWPKRIGGGLTGTGDVESSPLFADIDGDNRNELLVTGSDGIVHAYRRDGSEPDGWPVHGDRLPLHTTRALTSGEVDGDVAGAILASLAAGDLDRDGAPEVVAADLEGKVYVWNAAGERVLTLESNRAFSGAPLAPFVPERHGKLNRTQHGFIGSPVLADLDRNDGGRLEIVAAAMDRHVYAWNDDGSAVPGFPVLVVDPAKVAAVDPVSHRVTFKDDVGATEQQGAIIDTPAVGDISGDARPEIVVGTNEEYAAGADGGLNVAPLNATAISLVEPAGLLDFANTRLYAIDADGGIVDGWPFKLGKVFAELLPVVGEGVTGAPVIGELSCLHGGKGPKVGVIPDGGPAMVLNPDASSCIGELNGKPIGMQSDIPDGNPIRADVVTLPAVGHAAFGDIGGGTSLLAPTTGILRALDLAVNEYQGGEDSLSAWDPATGQFRLGFPQRTNDLSFLTGPSVGDIGGLPGEEAVAGTAYLDLQAFGAGGLPPSAAWPKLTSDWMVANPLLGSFGELEYEGAARKTVVAATRAGVIHAYGTGAGPCTPSSWPRFHHDNHNSGDTRTDAVAPGRPLDVSRLPDNRVSLRAPGDDLLCGTAARYEVHTGAGGWQPLEGATPVAGGRTQTLTVPAGAHRIRAVDEQGNPGRAATPPPPPASPPHDPGQQPPSASPPAAGTPACTDRDAPTSRVGRIRRAHATITLSGVAIDHGCATPVISVTVAIARRSGSRCRFLAATGTLGHPRPCSRPRTIRTRGTSAWSLRLPKPLPSGRYTAWSRATDAAGNTERRSPTRRFAIPGGRRAGAIR